MARQRRGGKHRRQRRRSGALPAVGGCALALAVTGALGMPADASDTDTDTGVLAAPAAATPTASPDPASEVEAATFPRSSRPGPSADAHASADADAAEAPAARPAVPHGATMRTARELTVAAERAAVKAERARAERRAARAKAIAQAYKRPTSGYRITAKFGTGGGYWSSGRHTGLDFATKTGRTVHAVTAGKVVEAGWAGAYGQQVVIKHARGVSTTYSHLSKVKVDKGDKVTAGQAIGAVGSTGNTTGPHLHLEVLNRDDKPVDPMVWLRKHGVRL